MHRDLVPFEINYQMSFLGSDAPPQLLKWVGNKQRYAKEITRHFPSNYGRYIEPFLGSGAVLAAVSPKNGIAGDSLGPLIDFWKQIQKDPAPLLEYYESAWHEFQKNKLATYERLRESYNRKPNALDLLVICRSCYGGVVRFTKRGTISTPVGAHTPISSQSLAQRIRAWRERIKHVKFLNQNFEETMAMAKEGDIIYCDPPYCHSQAILYGAQDFSLERLFQSIRECKKRGSLVALSIDGSKKSGRFRSDIRIPEGLFESEAAINCGRSMLRRFQRSGQTLEDEVVQDRLLMTW